MTTAAMTGAKLQVVPGDKFNMKYGNMSLTDPVASATHLAIVTCNNVNSHTVQLYTDQPSVLQWLMCAAGVLYLITAS